VGVKGLVCQREKGAERSVYFSCDDAPSTSIEAAPSTGHTRGATIWKIVCVEYSSVKYTVQW
jgi:hypothetical protein